MDGATVPRVRAWGRALATAFLVLGACAAAVGCGGGSNSDADDERARQRAEQLERRRQQLVGEGRTVFYEHCHSCHGLNGRPHSGTTGEWGMSFDEVRPTRAYIGQRLLMGGYGMQSFQGVLSKRERAAVTEFVLDVSGSNIPDRTEGDLAAGAELFEQHCQTCHSIDGRRRTSDYVWPGTNFDDVQIGPGRIRRMVNIGDWWMPSQMGRLQESELADVIHYVVSVSGQGRSPERR